MVESKRPQNRCSTCKYTWHPRGKEKSLRCPKCGAETIEVPLAWLAPIRFLFGLVAVVFVVGLAWNTEKTVPIGTSIPVQSEINSDKHSTDGRVSGSNLRQGATNNSSPANVDSAATSMPQTSNAPVEELPSSPSQICKGKEGSFFFWNNCMWEACKDGKFSKHEECENRVRPGEDESNK